MRFVCIHIYIYICICIHMYIYLLRIQTRHAKSFRSTPHMASHENVFCSRISWVCIVNTLLKFILLWTAHNERINVRLCSTYRFGLRSHVRLMFSKRLMFYTNSKQLTHKQNMCDCPYQKPKISNCNPTRDQNHMCSDHFEKINVFYSKKKQNLKLKQKTISSATSYHTDM